jgi:uncharacterized protein (UPF0147 family)
MSIETVASHLISILNRIIEDEKIDQNLRSEVVDILPG